MSHSHPAENSNRSANPELQSFIEQRVSRRDVLKGGATLSAGLAVSTLGLAACNGSEGEAAAPTLGFTPVAKSTADLVSIPAGYTARALFAWGDPLKAGGTLPTAIHAMTAAQQEAAAGDHHDGMHYFGLSLAGLPDADSSMRGLLAMNHEAITEDFAHPLGPSYNNLSASGGLQASSARTSASECLKEMALHGVSVVEVARGADGHRYVQGSAFNRRITTYTPVEMTGPARGSSWLQTAYDADGIEARGTLNNCANGYTPWGTYLTCEENWAGYFGHAGTVENRQLRYGIAQHGFQNLRWYTAPDPLAGELPPGAGGMTDLMRRYQLNATGANATQDFRNEANTFGYVVEIDPYDPASTPKKRTALGRMAHEGCWPRVVKGKPLAFYMGDDGNNEYFYKFVTQAVYTGTEARQNNLLDNGTLHVAVFNADGTGTWKALTPQAAELNGMTQAEICVFTREAADRVGATKMDRPEWTAVNPRNGEVYLTLTNNTFSTSATTGGRATTGENLAPIENRGKRVLTDPANPRAYSDQRQAGDAFTSARTTNGNANGHIIRIRESQDEPGAVTFRWDIYLFAAEADADPAKVNLSGLTAVNELSSPDGFWFDDSGIAWIQTDDSALLDETNCAMLAGVPGRVWDGGPLNVTSSLQGVDRTVTTMIGAKPTEANLRRFLVGPKGCEITGIDMTPDRRTMFVNIQHPGESGGFANYSQTVAFQQQSGYNALETTEGQKRARSTTLVITRNDGGVIGG